MSALARCWSSFNFEIQPSLQFLVCFRGFRNLGFHGHVPLGFSSSWPRTFGSLWITATRAAPGFTSGGLADPLKPRLPRPCAFCKGGLTMSSVDSETLVVGISGSHPSHKTRRVGQPRWYYFCWSFAFRLRTYAAGTATAPPVASRNLPVAFLTYSGVDDLVDRARAGLRGRSASPHPLARRANRMGSRLVKGVGVLRLRVNSAARNSRSAQDDKGERALALALGG